MAIARLNSLLSLLLLIVSAVSHRNRTSLLLLEEDVRLDESDHLVDPQGAVLLEVHNCSTEDFRRNGSCELWCTARRSPLSVEKYHEWMYYGDSIDRVYYVFTEGTAVVDVADDTATYSLTLDDYRAGYYEWRIQYFDPPDSFEELRQVFRIEPDVSGAPLGGRCEDATDCLALDSHCLDGKCQCVDPSRYPIEFDPDASACVPVAEPGERCYTSLQCEAQFNCSEAYLCECDAYYVHVNETDDSRCVRSRVYQEACLYDVECTLNDDQSLCSDHRCDCLPGYRYTTYDYRCEAVRSGLSVSAIVGIVAAVLLLHVVGYVAYLCYRQRTKRRRGEEARHLQWNEETTDYQTFSLEDPTVSGTAFSSRDEEVPTTVPLQRMASGGEDDAEHTKL